MKDKKKILAFLQGFALCNNVIYVFNYNTFYLNISCLISLVTLIYIIVTEKNNVSKYLKRIDKFFYLFLFFCLLSIIPMFFYFKNDLSVTNAFFNGLPSLILIFIEYFIIIALYDHKRNIFQGILLGFIINIIFSLLQYIFFQQKQVFTLYRLFPNPAFQIPGDYFVLSAMPDIVSSLKIYSFRAQGLFLETSYFLTFVIGSILIVMNVIKNNVLKIILLLISLWLCIISESGNLLILLFILIAYLIISFIKRKGKKTINRKIVLLIPCIMVIVCLSALFVINNPKITNSLDNSLISANMEDSGNHERFLSIERGINLIIKYPFGIGYNMSSTIYAKEYGNEYVNAIFSTLIVNELEIGLLGNLMYIIFSLKMIIYALHKKENKTCLALGLSALGMFACQITNGISYWLMLYIICVFAMINASMYEEEQDK